MVYLWKKNGKVYHHASLDAARQLDGITRTPDMEIPDAEFEADGGLARLIDGAIVIGKTAEETQAEQNTAQIALLKQRLADTDYIVVKIAEGAATIDEYADKIAERQAWRAEIESLSA